MSFGNLTTKQQQLNEYTRLIDVFVPYSDEASAIETATSVYPLDYNESTGRFTRVDGCNRHSTGYVVTIRQGYDY